MRYVGDRLVFDADSHVMELPGWLEAFADGSTAEALRPLALGGAGALAERAVEEAAARQAGGVSTLDTDPIALLHSKGWGAVGAFDSTERSFVLDQLGFAAQLVFPTFAATQFAGNDLDLLYGGSDALNRAMAAFCADDVRMLAVASVPWGDPDRTVECARLAIAEGCRAVMVPTDLPRAGRCRRRIPTTARCGRCSKPRTFPSSATSAEAGDPSGRVSTTTATP